MSLLYNAWTVMMMYNLSDGTCSFSAELILLTSAGSCRSVGDSTFIFHWHIYGRIRKSMTRKRRELCTFSYSRDKSQSFGWAGLINDSHCYSQLAFITYPLLSK